MDNLYMITPSSNDIQHHGILGMRWGRKNGPPYPLGSSDHSASEKKAGWRKSLSSGGIFGKRKKAKADRVAKANAKKIVEERLKDKEADEFFEKNKEKILRSNKAKDVLSNQARLTNQELQEAVNRLNLNSQLSQYEVKQRPATNWEKIDKVIRGPVKDMVDWTDIGIRAWNDLAKMYNVTPQGQKEKLPVIGQGGGDNNQKKK